MEDSPTTPECTRLILSEIHGMKGELEQLRSSIRDLQRVCGRMDSHISFVEHTYTRIRSPLQWVLHKIGWASKAVPVLGDAPHAASITRALATREATTPNSPTRR